MAQTLPIPEEELQRQHLVDSPIPMVQLAIDPTAEKDSGLLMSEALTEP